MRINEIINETTSSGGIATVAMPMTKMVRRPSPVTKKKKKKKVSETFVIIKQKKVMWVITTKWLQLGC